jgi:imidazolonepropionase-like amidohydrolase
MYGAPAAIRAWKAKSESGAPWPRLIGAGHILDGSPPVWPGSTVAMDAEQARRAVDELHAAGADFIKVYNGLPREAYAAAVDEAKRLGTHVAGHVPDAVSVAEASDLGQRSIEHLTGVAIDCSSDGGALRAERVAAAREEFPKRIAIYLRQVDRVLAMQDPTRCSDLIARLARNQTWQVPTLVELRAMAMLDDDRFTADPRVRYMPAEVTKSWNWREDFRLRSRTPEDWSNAKRLYRRNLEIVGLMHRADVPLLAGTDVLNPFAFPGFSLHDELALMVDAGLSPAEALRTATLAPAVFLDATSDKGTVEVGKRADLVLLDANPLENIRNTQAIRAVVLNGRLYDRPALDAWLRPARGSEAGGQPERPEPGNSKSPEEHPTPRHQSGGPVRKPYSAPAARPRATLNVAATARASSSGDGTSNVAPLSKLQK